MADFLMRCLYWSHLMKTHANINLGITYANDYYYFIVDHEPSNSRALVGKSSDEIKQMGAMKLAQCITDSVGLKGIWGP